MKCFIAFASSCPARGVCAVRAGSSWGKEGFEAPKSTCHCILGEYWWNRGGLFPEVLGRKARDSAISCNWSISGWRQGGHLLSFQKNKWKCKWISNVSVRSNIRTEAQVIRGRKKNQLKFLYINAIISKDDNNNDDEETHPTKSWASVTLTLSNRSLDSELN